MESYDPNFHADNYDPNNPHGQTTPWDNPDQSDPDAGYIRDDQTPPLAHDPNTPGYPQVDVGVYLDSVHHPAYADDRHDNEDIHYADDGFLHGDIPEQVGVGDGADEHGNYGDGFDDDDDVYLDNHNRNENISPEIESSDPKDGMADTFWRNSIIACTCLFLVTGLIILSVRISQISKEDGKETYHHSSVLLRPPPPELAQICTHTRVLSEKGFYECEQLCEAADCCNYPTTLALSCLAGNDQECLTYHKHCNVLQLDQAALQHPPTPPQNLPEAPTDIDNKCNIESLRTVPGFEGCVNVCLPAECCWKKDGSVHPCTSLEVCSGYAACLTMDVTDHVHVDISKEITEKCADDKLVTVVGRNQCIFACSHAACCFDASATCPHEDARFCSQYQPCQKIFDEHGEVVQGGSAGASHIPVAPQFLDTACSKSSLDTLPGYEMCLGACTEAECCWKGKAECLGDSGCNGYHHCVSMLDHNSTDAPVTSENTIPTAPEYLAAACSAGSLDTSAGFQMCQDACMEAACCWKVTSCSERTECSIYASNCANLVARLDQGANGGSVTTPFLPEAPHDLNQECAPFAVLAKEGYDSCAASCAKAECCWKSGARDSCVSNTGCRAWAPCTVMNGAQDPDAVAAQDFSFEQVFDACLNHDNDVGGGSKHKSLCQIVCESGNCCFDETKGCANTLNCKVFEPCQVLHSEKQSEVEAVCNGGDLADCVGICATATCCFTSDIQKICDVTNPTVICKQYNACEVLYSAEVSNP